MSVVPDGAGIEVEASVENRDIGFVREGHAMEVKVDAFPFTRYRLIRGTLVHIGRDAAVPAPGHEAAGGPGAAGQRPVIAYLLSPVMEAVQEAGTKK